MSLINDALKRANKSLSEKKGELPPSIQIQPVEPSYSRNFWFPFLAPLVLVVVLISAGWFFWKFWSASPPLAASSPPATNQIASQVSLAPAASNLMARAIPALPAAATNRPQLPPAFTSPPPPRNVASNVAAAIRQATNPPVASVSSEPAAFPELKLQGIYFRRTKPSVMINGRHLYKGNVIENAQVVEIERQSVIVEFKGVRQTLLLQ